MTTLTSNPVAPLLERLFDAAAATSPWNAPAAAGLSADDVNALMHSKTGYRELYGHLKDFALPVSRETGTLLYMLARSMRAATIVEFGTSFGISTLHLAAALRDNGGGRLITTEFEPTKAVQAQANLAAGGLADLVELRIGDALQTLATDLPDTIDLLLLDGAKALYPEILALVESRLRPGALIVADNADYCPEYLARVRLRDGGYLSLPFDDDVEVSLRLA
ncbi:methyltransferase family protein [Pseudoduganella flava]|uniref:Methyltransferase family protein n=1 Tax=Pseudoduganella flava TaxID=871742 RepID=A0A562Q3R0_9BURK|nr:class I SAM-dependent methyltransferase [Pseudoduganella flava]QGZ41410.1 O-methyltransferase [Pseudoduganella flava]TWI51363.1 methyltransferase family protein [Pseudoduganella flava]